MGVLKKEKDIIVFDLETKGLIPKTKSIQKRNNTIKELKFSVVCAYSYLKEKYFFFTEENVNELFDLFKNSSLIVGFNIIGFDYKVLEKYGMPNDLITKSKDIFDLIRKETGNWYSLDKLSQENLGKGKLYKGKDLASMNGTDLYNGCKADVQIAKELYDLWEKGQLKYDKQRWSRNRYVTDDEWGDMLGYIPNNVCPFCGSKSLEKFDELSEGMGIDDMTEGELAGYMAGEWGTVYCSKCGKSYDFE